MTRITKTGGKVVPQPGTSGRTRSARKQKVQPAAPRGRAQPVETRAVEPQPAAKKTSGREYAEPSTQPTKAQLLPASNVLSLRCSATRTEGDPGADAPAPAAVASTDTAAVPTVSTGPTLKSIRSALVSAEEQLRKQGYRMSSNGPISGPYDAFFNVKNIAKRGQTWLDLYDQIELSQTQLDASEQRPVSLSPLNITLFRGHLFPDAYFMRSTLYWNEHRGGHFMRAPFKMTKLSRQMPYITLPRGTGSGTDSGLSTEGGSRAVFDIVKELLGSEGHITAYRGCSKSERALQLLIKDLIEGAQDEPISKEERRRLREIKTKHSDGLADALEGFEFNRRRPTRGEAASELADFLGEVNDATFVGFNREKAMEFTNLGDDTEEVHTDTVLTYRIPVAEMEQHVDRGTLYFGTEFDAVEAGFGEVPDHPEDQATKLLLYRHLVP